MTAAANPYRASRIRKGMLYFITGKALTSIAGIGTFLLLVRALPVEQFAAYSVLFALVDLFEIVSGVGITHMLARYIPEMYAHHHAHALRRFVARAIALRLLVALAGLAAVFLLAGDVAPLIGLDGFVTALRAYLAVVLFRIAAAMLFGALEAMLHQGVAQLGFTTMTVVRFAALGVLALNGELDLYTVILVEALTDLAGVVIMLVGLWRVLPKAPADPDDTDRNWLSRNLRRMVDFGLKGYVQHLLIVPFASGTNRMIVGGALPTPDVALYGFGQSIYELLNRYLPVQLFNGMIRPVMSARYSREKRFDEVVLFANMVMKLQLALIGLGVSVVAAGGSALLALITAGKYSERAVGLLMVMFAFLAVLTWRHVLDQTTHAVERNEPLIWANAVISLSLLGGIALLPLVGVYAMPLANTLGVACGNLVLVAKLRRFGFVFRHDLRGIGRIVLATALAIGAGEALSWAGLHWMGCTLAAALVYVASIVLASPADAHERRMVLEFVRSRGDAAPAAPAASVDGAGTAAQPGAVP